MVLAARMAFAGLNGPARLRHSRSQFGSKPGSSDIPTLDKRWVSNLHTAPYTSLYSLFSSKKKSLLPSIKGNSWIY